MSHRIPFNKPFLTGSEPRNIIEAVYSGHISGNGDFTKRCHAFFEERFGFRKCLLTSSCTDALEMCAILCDLKPGDEVIMPSYTFVSTANAFVLRGATIKFADSEDKTPCVCPTSVESLITPRTKAIVVVHYGGIACDMDRFSEMAKQHNLILIEDAAHAVDSYWNGKPLGSIGHLATFSFHETKNISCGEGGMLVVNDPRFIERSEIIWEKGTNRAAFFRNEVDKYRWVDIGSSFLPSDLSAAYLLAQIENLEKIQNQRIALWNNYNSGLADLSDQLGIDLPFVRPGATVNGHLFYINCRSEEERSSLTQILRQRGILAVFHYVPLHESPFFVNQHDGRALPNADRYNQKLLRLPLYCELQQNEQNEVIEALYDFYFERAPILAPNQPKPHIL